MIGGASRRSGCIAVWQGRGASGIHTSRCSHSVCTMAIRTLRPQNRICLGFTCTVTLLQHEPSAAQERNACTLSRASTLSCVQQC